jgi:hypothetical protein
MNESEITTKKILPELSKYAGSYWWKNHGDAFSVRGLPDVMGVVHGRLFAFEIKVGKNWVTPSQAGVLVKLADAEAIAGVLLYEGGSMLFAGAYQVASKKRSQVTWTPITEATLFALEVS